jgi:hypothetical protein
MTTFESRVRSTLAYQRAISSRAARTCRSPEAASKAAISAERPIEAAMSSQHEGPRIKVPSRSKTAKRNMQHLRPVAPVRGQANLLP